VEKKDGLRDLFKSADAVLEKAVRVNGKPASERTQELTRKVVYANLRILHGLGYRIEHIDNLRDKHLEAIVRYWWEHSYAPKTIQNNFSRLKIFCGWMGRGNMIRRGGAAAYLPDVPKEQLRVQTYTDTTKSWSGNGVHVEQMLETAKLEDTRWYCMLLLGLFFGLRQKEMLGLKPWAADKGRYLNIDGNIAKGGRPRVILLEDNKTGEFQRLVLNYVKRQCRKGEGLCWPGLTMEQGRKRYFHYMRKHGLTKGELGVTGHGLRAEYAENEAMRRGLLPPSLGGTRHQLPKESITAIAQEVSNNLGHNDLHTISAYYGSFRKARPTAWTRIGSIPLDDTRVAGIFTDPPLLAGPDGSYRQLSPVERAAHSIGIQIEGLHGLETSLDLAGFVSQHPEKESALLALLGARGLSGGIAP
jgi:integrase